MKRIVVAVLALLGLATLTGCGTSSSEAEARFDCTYTANVDAGAKPTESSSDSVDGEGQDVLNRRSGRTLYEVATWLTAVNEVYAPGFETDNSEENEYNFFSRRIAQLNGLVGDDYLVLTGEIKLPYKCGEAVPVIPKTS